MVAALVAIVGLLGGLMWAFAALAAVNAEGENFPRLQAVPGELTVELHPGTWYVYAERGAEIAAVEVADDDGNAVSVEEVSSQFMGGYDQGGTTAEAAAKFSIRPGAMGEYTISVTGTDPSGDGGFAVGEFDIGGFRLRHTIGMVALLVVNLGTAIALTVWTVGQRRRTA